MAETKTTTKDLLDYLHKEGTEWLNYSLISELQVTHEGVTVPEFTLQVINLKNALTGEEQFIMNFVRFWVGDRLDKDGVPQAGEKEIIATKRDYLINDIDTMGVFLAKLTPKSNSASFGARFEFSGKDKTTGEPLTDLNSFCAKGILTRI